MEFETLLKENKTAIEVYVKYRVSSYADQQDLLQEICLQAYQKFPELKNEASFKPWLISIARNKINDYYRRKAKENEVVLNEDLPFVSLQRSFNEKVYATLKLLSESDKEILILFYWKEYSIKEIADLLRVPEGTVKSRLYNARKHFKNRYPKEEKMKTKKMPEILPEYRITKIDDEPFEVVWEELMGWFLIPKEGNRLRFGIYDFPSRNCSETIEMNCQGKAEVHGLRGVKVFAQECDVRGNIIERRFVAQLSDTHCRFLSESHEEEGITKYFTFLDGDAFLNNWGFGPDNIGNPIHLKQKGKITKEGNRVTVNESQEVMDVVGRYKISINGKAYDTTCLMDIGVYDDEICSEQYIDKSGKTVLWRRFNRGNKRWLFDGFETIENEKLKGNEKLYINNKVCYHWYDCITDYVL